MAETGSTCPHCHAVVTPGGRFCGNCGATLDAPSLPATAARPVAKTVLGLDAEQVRLASEALRAAREQARHAPEKLDKPAPVISEAGRRALGQTMLGFAEGSQPMAAAVRAAVDAPKGGAAFAPPTAAGPDSRPPLAPRDSAASLPLGVTPMPGRWSEPPMQNVGEDPAPAAPVRAAQHTVLGLSAPLPGRASPPSAAAFAPLPNPASAQTSMANPKLSNRTMLGMSTVASGAPAPDDNAAPRAAANASGVAGTMMGMSTPLPPSDSHPPPERKGRGRTMLGVPLAALGPAAGSGPPPSAAEPQSAWSFSDPDRPSQAGSARSSSPDAPYVAARSGAVAWWPIALAGVLLVLLCGMLLARLFSHATPTDVAARIVSHESGETLLFDVPSAPAGSRLRFGGQEQPLVKGHASFPLAADSLRVGDNVVLADVIKPNGDTSSARITLAVFYRVWVDTAALRADRAALDVVVTAVPGTRVTLEGEELKLDAQGHGTRSFPLDVVHQAKAGVIEHVVHYRMQPPSGETVVDELHTLIPVAMMQIDRPGREVVTDRESLEIAGAVGRDTKVSVDGTDVPVKDQRFLYRLELPKPGDYQPRVVASAAGKAPLGVTLSIRRVENLVQAAREFETNTSLTYAKLAPNPTIYRGQAIALEGRVYAFDARAGSSVIQMLVRPCPSSQRCSLWVVDPQAGEVAVDRWIRVLGTVDGEQQFRSEKNEVVTVPKIVARFILPAKP